MPTAFEVGVTVYLIDRVSAELRRMSSAFGAGGRTVGGMQRRVSELERSMRRAQVAAVGFGVAFAAGAIAIEHQVKAAGDLQDAMVRMQVATGASAKQIASLEPELMNVSHATIFSATKVADLGTALGTVGLNAKQVADLLPVVARGAEVLSRQGVAGPVQAATMLGQIAKVFGATNAQQMLPIAEVATKLGIHTPGGFGQLQRMVAYTGAEGRLLGLTPEQTLLLAGGALQTTGGKGALSPRALLRMITKTIPGTLGAGLFHHTKQMQALQALGLVDVKGKSTVFDAQGKFSLPSLMQHLRQDERTMPRLRVEALLQQGFGSVGGRAGAIMGTQQFADTLLQLFDYVKQQQDIVQLQLKYLDTLNGRMQQFSTDLTNLLAVIGQPMLAPLQAVIKSMDAFTASLTVFLAASPRAAKVLGDVELALTGIAGLGAAAAVISMVSKSLAILRAAGGIGGATATVAAAGGGVIAGAGALAAGAAIGEGIVKALGGHEKLGAELFTLLPKSARDLLAGSTVGLRDWNPTGAAHKLDHHEFMTRLRKSLEDPHGGAVPEPLKHPDSSTPPTAAKGGVHHMSFTFGNIIVNGGGGKPDEVARKVLDALPARLRTAMMSVSTGEGVLESPFFHSGGETA